MFLVMVACLMTFGEKNAGLSMIITGGILLFINYYIGINVVQVVVPTLFMFFGTIAMWGTHRKEGGG